MPSHHRVDGLSSGRWNVVTYSAILLKEGLSCIIIYYGVLIIRVNLARQVLEALKMLPAFLILLHEGFK